MLNRLCAIKRGKTSPNKLLGLLGLSIVLVVNAGLLAPVAANQTVNITADKQSFDSDGRTNFSGNVNVVYNDVTIKSNQATLDINEDGIPDIATFFPKPLAKRLTDNGQDDLNADIIKIFINEDKIRAEGNTQSYLRTVAENPAIIQADMQEFSNKTKIVRALGNVFVDYDTTKIYSPEAKLWMNEAGQAKRAIFSGGSRAEQEQSKILSERLTIIAANGNLLAENNVKTNIKTDAKKPGDPEQVLIDSDFQQYDKASETMLASGNVKIKYGDYKAFGPKATFKLKDGQVEKIILTGRGKIITPSRQVLADQIVITTNPKHFDATGNVKSKFVTGGDDADSNAPTEGGSSTSGNTVTPVEVTTTEKQETSEQKPSDEYLE